MDSHSDRHALTPWALAANRHPRQQHLHGSLPPYKVRLAMGKYRILFTVFD